MKKIVLSLFIFLIINYLCAQTMSNPPVFQRSSYSALNERRISLDTAFVQTLESIDASYLNNAVLLNFCTSNHDFFEISSADNSRKWLVNSDGSVIATGAKLQYYDKVVVVSLATGVFQVVSYQGLPFRHDLNLAPESGEWFDDVRYITGSKGSYLVLKPYQGSRYMLVTPDFRRVGTWFETVSDAQAEWEREEGR
jgi:hypothetical protein